jgi:hypothetical protein
MRKQSSKLAMAPLPGYVSNYVPCPGAYFSANFGGCSGLQCRMGPSGTIGRESCKNQALRVQRACCEWRIERVRRLKIDSASEEPMSGETQPS